MRIVANPAPDATLPTWDISDSATIDIGGADEGPEAFDRIATAYWDRLGRIVVVDSRAGEIRRFSAEGEFLDSFGGKGEGPGEFRFLARAWPLGDSTCAYDPGLRLISIFDPAGRLARTISIASTARPYSVEPLEGGRFAMSFIQMDTSGATSGPPVRRPLTVAITALDGVALDTVLTLPGIETYPVLQHEGEASFPGEQTPAFGRWSIVHAVGNRIYAVTNESFEIREFDTTGKAQRIVRALLPARPVREEDRAAQLLQALQEIDRFNTEAPEALREQWRQSERARRVASEFPFIDDFIVTPGGDIWAEQYRWQRDAPRRYLVFDSDGRLVARAEAPARTRPRAVRRDAALAVWRDADDIEHVRVYPVRRPGARANQEVP